MKRKMLSILLVAAMTMTMLTACKKNVGTPEDNAVAKTEENTEETETGSILFGYSGSSEGNPYYETLKLSIQTEVEAKGHRLMVRDPEGDAALQNEQMKELIEEGVKAVFVSPTDAGLVTEGLQALDEAGVPVINVDTQVKESDLTAAFIGSDNKNAGYVCGEDLKEKLPNGGKIIIMECSNRNSINQRITGFEEAIADAGFEVLNRAETEGERENAKAAMQKFLAEYPEIDAVMCGNDPAALGVLEAVEEADRSGILIYGVDGSPEVKQKLAENNQSLTGTGAQSPINIGKKAVETAMNILNKEKYESEVYEETFLITRDNVELYGTDGWQ